MENHTYGFRQCYRFNMNLHDFLRYFEIPTLTSVGNRLEKSAGISISLENHAGRNYFDIFCSLQFYYFIIGWLRFNDYLFGQRHLQPTILPIPAKKRNFPFKKNHPGSGEEDQVSRVTSRLL